MRGDIEPPSTRIVVVEHDGAAMAPCAATINAVHARIMVIMSPDTGIQIIRLWAEARKMPDELFLFLKVKVRVVRASRSICASVVPEDKNPSS